MKSLNRTLSLVLVLVMVFGLFGVASATSFKDDTTIQYKEAVDVMTGIGAINGYTDGTFAPKGTITREEAAKMITYAVLGPTIAKTLSVASTGFKDVASTRWSAPFIAYCVSKGIINGMGDGTFAPEGNITGYQLAKMLLCATGYGKQGEYTGASWELNVAIDANRLGVFTSSKAASFAVAATREEAALYVFNAVTMLEDVKYDKNTSSYAKQGANTTIAASVYKIDATNTSTVAQVTAKAVNATTKAVNTTIGTNTFANDVNNALVGHNVRVYYSTVANADGTLNAYSVVDVSTTYTVPATVTTAAELTKALGYIATMCDATAVPTYTNYAKTTADYITLAASTAIADGDIAGLVGKTLVLTNKVVTAVILPTAYTIETIGDIVTTAGAETINVGGTVRQNNATSDVVKEYTGIAKGDVVIDVVVAPVHYLTKVTTVEGTITKINGTTLTVNGVDYKYNNVGDNSGIADDSYVNDFKSTFVLYLTANNEYFAVKVKTPTAAVSDATYVATTFTGSTSDAYGVATVTTYAQTVALDGTVKNVVVGVKVGTAGQQGVATLAAGLYTFKLSSTAADAAVGIYTATAVTAADDNGANINSTTVKQAQDVLNGDFTFKSTLTSIPDTATATVTAKAYLTANTKFLFVDKTLATMKVEVKTGPINYSFVDGDHTLQSVLFSKDAQGNLIVDAVVIGGTYTDAGIVASDYVFVAKAQNAPAQTATGYLFDIYTSAGAKQTVTASNTTLAVGFCTYKVVNGVYTLTPVTGTYFDEYTYQSRFGTKISADGATDLVDADATAATIVDVDATTGTAVTSVTGFVTTTKFYALVNPTTNTVSAIFVTDRA